MTSWTWSLCLFLIYKTTSLRAWVVEGPFTSGLTPSLLRVSEVKRLEAINTGRKEQHWQSLGHANVFTGCKNVSNSLSAQNSSTSTRKELSFSHPLSHLALPFAIVRFGRRTTVLCRQTKSSWNITLKKFVAVNLFLPTHNFPAEVDFRTCF